MGEKRKTQSRNNLLPKLFNWKQGETAEIDGTKVNWKNWDFLKGVVWD